MAPLLIISSITIPRSYVKMPTPVADSVGSEKTAPTWAEALFQHASQLHRVGRQCYLMTPRWTGL